MKSLQNEIVELSERLGFDIIAFAGAEKIDEAADNYQSWVDSGYHAGLGYLEKNIDKRRNVLQIMPEAKTIIALGMNYSLKLDRKEGEAQISTYALGDDYHDVMLKKMKLIEDMISSFLPDTVCRSYVDTGPTLDRAWAVKAGLGWQGKNGNIISPLIGSKFFIGLIITSLELKPSEQVRDMCGKCRKCIDACPTGAIIQPKVVDSRKCISFWTIEAKPEAVIPAEIAKNSNAYIYGCDICQDVCPWNIKLAKDSREIAFHPRNAESGLDPEIIRMMTQEEFSIRFKNSPIKRLKLAGLKRNLRDIFGLES